MHFFCSYIMTNRHQYSTPAVEAAGFEHENGLTVGPTRKYQPANT